jgi:hypothetical protein
MGRSQSLIQPPDLLPTLFDWLRMESGQPSRFAQSMLPLVRGEQEMLRDHVALLGGGAERALRTPAWYLRRPGSDDSRPSPEGCELFVKPDDRWEQNEISSRCADVTERLAEVLQQFQQWTESGQQASLPPLEDILLRGFS